MAITPLITSDELPETLTNNVSETVLDLMIKGASAAAYRAAPCLKDSPSEDQLAEAKLVLMSAVSRWLSDGSGMAGSTQTAGPFTQGTTPPPIRAAGYRLWPSEIADLRSICKIGGGVTSIELVSSQGPRRRCLDDFDAGPPDCEES